MSYLTKKSIQKFFFSPLLLGLFSSLVQASTIPPELRSPHDQWIYGDGAARGGVADAYLSLFDIRNSISRKLKAERVIIDWGNAIGQPSMKGGYYQVEYQAKRRRVIINLALALNSKVDPKKLAARFTKGLYVRQAKLEYDASSQSQNLILELKKPMKVRVASYPSHLKSPQIPARLVVDLVE